MKKIMFWISIVASIVVVIDWGIIGLKLLDGNYDITAGAYVGLACILIIAVCAVYKVFHNKCPHCGKLLQLNGKYCPHCGKKITE